MLRIGKTGSTRAEVALRQGGSGFGKVAGASCIVAEMAVLWCGLRALFMVGCLCQEAGCASRAQGIQTLESSTHSSQECPVRLQGLLVLG